MPVYSYRCENCGEQFDQFQRFTDPPLVECPVCHVAALRKVYTPVGIVFKGSGFYATDHRSPSGSRSDNKPAASEKTDSGKPAESAPASSPGSSTSGSSDSA